MSMKKPEDCANIPTEEVVQDRKEALADLCNAYKALSLGMKEYDGDAAVFRINANLNQIKVIDSVLIYRGWEGELPCL